MESEGRKRKRNIKKVSDGTAFQMLRNQALFASERPGLKLKKKKIGRKASVTKKKKKSILKGIHPTFEGYIYLAVFFFLNLSLYFLRCIE